VVALDGDGVAPAGGGVAAVCTAALPVTCTVPELVSDEVLESVAEAAVSVPAVLSRLP